MILGDVSAGRENNLNFMRFVAASLVIFSHCVPFSLGKGNSDVLNTFSKGEMTFGGLAVSLFFFFGGFLIARSVQRTKTAKDYFKARLIRIIPCLFVVVALCALVLGPIITTLSLKEYYTNVGTYKYLLNSVFILVHNLPGVFTENVFDASVNGPLWTLPVEFLCYVACFVVYKLGLLDEKKLKWTIPVVLVGYVGVWYIFHTNTVLFAAVRPALLFYIGMLCYVYRDKIKLNGKVAMLCVVGYLLSCMLGILKITVYFLLPYIFLCLAFGTKKKLSKFGSKAEISYGMYLLGSPIQQTIAMLFGGSMIPAVNFVIALPIDILLAYLLWMLVERPINKFIHKSNKKEQANG